MYTIEAVQTTMEIMEHRITIPTTREADPGVLHRIPWSVADLATQTIVALNTQPLTPHGSVALIAPPSATDLGRGQKILPLFIYSSTANQEMQLSGRV